MGLTLLGAGLPGFFSRIERISYSPLLWAFKGSLVGSQSFKIGLRTSLQALLYFLVANRLCPYQDADPLQLILL